MEDVLVMLKSSIAILLFNFCAASGWVEQSQVSINVL